MGRGVRVTDWLVLGKIVGARGLQGEVRVHSFSDFPERFEEAGERWLRSPTGSPYPVQLVGGSAVPGKTALFWVRFAHLTSREAAEAAVGLEILVPATNRPVLAPDEFYVPDLVGCAVYDRGTGQVLGKVTAVVGAGQALLEVQDAAGRTGWIPFVEALVPLVDVAQGRVEVDLPPGLWGEPHNLK
ncbi:MAG: ribosome maturation factor RimM [Oscillatoriales cyanobacterium SM2_1_8]|nr:ribosome maturation factor RimM [Oscillatoriales cyanobacterium SM2_1_8]